MGLGRSWRIAACVAAAGVTASAWGAERDTTRAAAITGSKATIYSSLPRQGATGDQARAIERGATMALDDRGGKVGRYEVAYKRLDDSLPSTGYADEERGKRNARKAAGDKTTVGYIGEYNSFVSKVTIPILHKAGIAQISPSNVYVGLTSDAPGHEAGEPGVYYPSGRRTYARVIPNDTVQAAALATATRNDGCRSVHVLKSGTTYSNGLARTIGATGRAIGLKVKRTQRYDPDADGYRSLAKRVTAPCVIQTGEIELSGLRVLKAVAKAHERIHLYGADGVCLNANPNPRQGVPPSVVARHFRCTIASLDPAAFGRAGRRFFHRFAKRYGRRHVDPYAIYGYEAMALMLRSMERALGAGGSVARDDVVRALFTTKNRESVLGRYTITARGDTTIRKYGLYKIRRSYLTFARVIKSVRPVVKR